MFTSIFSNVSWMTIPIYEYVGSDEHRINETSFPVSDIFFIENGTWEDKPCSLVCLVRGSVQRIISSPSTKEEIMALILKEGE